MTATSCGFPCQPKHGSPESDAFTDAGRAVPSLTPRRSAPPAAILEWRLIAVHHRWG